MMMSASSGGARIVSGPAEIDFDRDDLLSGLDASSTHAAQPIPGLSFGQTYALQLDFPPIDELSDTVQVLWRGQEIARIPPEDQGGEPIVVQLDNAAGDASDVLELLGPNLSEINSATISPGPIGSVDLMNDAVSTLSTTPTDAVPLTDAPDVVNDGADGDQSSSLGGMETSSGFVDGSEGGGRLFGSSGPDGVRGSSGETLLSGDGDAEILGGNSAADHVNARAGDDTMDGSNGRNRIEGQHGPDQQNEAGSSDAPFGGTDVAAKDGGNGGGVSQGGFSADAIFGDLGTDHIAQGAASDTLIGGEGDDHIWDSELITNGELDAFVKQTGTGTDYIHDFQVSADVVDLSAYNISYDDLQAAMKDVGWATQIELTGFSGQVDDRIYLKNVEPDQLDETNFAL
ncbi:MAG: hypothetical protein AAF293_02560 [Pseudomonadota bacterium]